MASFLLLEGHVVILATNADTEQEKTGDFGSGGDLMQLLTNRDR